MTLQKYEAKLEKVKANWHKMPEWVKNWTRDILKEDLKELKCQ